MREAEGRAEEVRAPSLSGVKGRLSLPFLFALQPANDLGGCERAALCRHALNPARRSGRDPDRCGGLTEGVCKQFDNGGVRLPVAGTRVDCNFQAVAVLADDGRSPCSGLHVQCNADPRVVQLNPGRQGRRDRIALWLQVPAP